MQLALLELQLLQAWESKTGAKMGDPLEFVGRWLAPLGVVMSSAELEWDSLLILALSLTLGAVLLVRQRQQLTTT